ncbi:MAG: HD domain-containing protein [Desulfobacteraceae bacterium]|nr:HD domain-containing protein [Desulfobacteraceae bacterium]
MAKVFISDIRPNQEIQSLFVAAERQLRTARNGKPYLDVKFTDKTGEISGKMWEKAAETAEHFKPGDVVYLRARSELYSEKLQLNVTEILPVPDGGFDSSDFLPVCPLDLDVLFERLEKALNQISDGFLRRLCLDMIGDAGIAARFRRAPAAKSMHHAYLGGLLEHTFSVIGLAYRICAHYPDLDRDLLTAGAFLHDIGKIEEFVYDVSIEYSDAGRLVGHMVLGVQMIEEKIRGIEGFPQETAMLLKHLVLSHHGEAQFGAVKLPASREAFALHLADDLDAKMNAIRRIVSKPGYGDSTWTGFETLFGRHFFRGFPASAPEEGPAECGEGPDAGGPGQKGRGNF